MKIYISMTLHHPSFQHVGSGQVRSHLIMYTFPISKCYQAEALLVCTTTTRDGRTKPWSSERKCNKSAMHCKFSYHILHTVACHEQHEANQPQTSLMVDGSFNPCILIVSRVDLNDSTEPIRKAFYCKVGVMPEHKQRNISPFFSNSNDNISKKSIINLIRLIMTESKQKTSLHKIQCLQIKQHITQNLY